MSVALVLEFGEAGGGEVGGRESKRVPQVRCKNLEDMIVRKC